MAAEQEGGSGKGSGGSSWRGSGKGSRRGGGKGRDGRRQGIGPPKECKCPSCGHTVPHQPGQPCIDQVCPKCGTNMTGM